MQNVEVFHHVFFSKINIECKQSGSSNISMPLAGLFPPYEIQFPLTENPFPLTENPFPLTENPFPLTENQFHFPEIG